MQYRPDKYGNPVSVLGYGCMRFSQSVTGIQMKKAEEEVLAAIDAGVNYFDTAYIYPGSESALGEILAKNRLRDQVNIATKLPHYLLKNSDSMEKYFSEQLRRLQTDHVDFYLMHMLTDVKTWERLKELGMLTWIAEKKASGAIRQIGFSYHGNTEMFCSLVDAYEWDFAMIQYNYLDRFTQAGEKGLHYAASRGLPVMVMEPLRGGRLVNDLPAEALRLFEEYPVEGSPAAWSFRWLWDQPEVTCVLSGMNSLSMVEENTREADKALAGALTERDHQLLADVVSAINAHRKVGCTGCRYCVPCPQKVDIPGIFAAYNRLGYDGKFHALRDYFMCTTLRKDATAASNCIGCGKCERHCPQGIQIRKELQNAKNALEGPVYKIGSKVIKTFMKY